MTSATEPQDAWVGRVLAGRYRLDALVGKGGTGSVYRATHLGLSRTVAVKLLHPALVDNETTVARFRREARAASRLAHPNCVQVLDFGAEQGGPTYLAMEYLQGRELFRVIYDDWPLSSERIVSLLGQVLAVLGAAHEMGIVHRDLKPENIMLVPGAGAQGDLVKVTDFGIAKGFSNDNPADSLQMQLTRDGSVAGTPEYMSPEQARGETLDGRCDLYACGVILYEMLTGTLPFGPGQPFDVLMAHLTAPVQPPSQRRKGIDPRLEPVVMRALEKDRARRYASAQEMAAALESALHGGELARGQGSATTLETDSLGGVTLDTSMPIPLVPKGAAPLAHLEVPTVVDLPSLPATTATVQAMTAPRERLPTTGGGEASLPLQPRARFLWLGLLAAGLLVAALAFALRR